MHFSATQVSLETGGVSLEKIEKTLKENISNLIGRWDRDADAPEGGAKIASYKNAWKSGTAGGSVGDNALIMLSTAIWFLFCDANTISLYTPARCFSSLVRTSFIAESPSCRV